MSEYEYDFENPKAPGVPLPKSLPEAEGVNRAYKSIETRMRMRMFLLNFLPALITPRRWSSTSAYARPWFKDPPSPVVRTWNLDAEFGRQRLAGMDPTVIERVEQIERIPERVRPSHNVNQRQLGESISFEALVADGRAFVCDYGKLGGYEREKGKYFVAPLAVFGWDERREVGDRLMPLAIRLGHEAGAPVRFPEASEEWLVAKYFVQVADAVHGDMWSHLVQSHFTATPFAISTKRKLEPGHPIRAIIEPHTQYTLRVNSQFTEGPAQWLYKKLMPFTKAGRDELIKDAYADWSFDAKSFEGDLKARGVWDGPGLKDYPYRDDGKLLWEAIRDYTREVLDRHYPDDPSVQNDVALQDWFSDLTTAGRVAGLEPALTTRAYLHHLVSNIVMHLGPKHAAVHSPAADFGIFAPNMSNASYRASDAEVSRLLDYLPGRWHALLSFMLHYAISEIEFGQFLGYSEGFRTASEQATGVRQKQLLEHDQHLRSVADRLTHRLVQIEAELRVRNALREKRFQMHYPYLVPSRIPNSIYA